MSTEIGEKNNEANPDINLNVEVVSWNDIYTVVNTQKKKQKTTKAMGKM